MNFLQSRKAKQRAEIQAEVQKALNSNESKGKDIDDVLNAFVKHLKNKPLTPAENQESYVKNGFLGNDHVFAVINKLVNNALLLPIYLYEVVDEKAYNRYVNYTKSNDPIRAEQFFKKAMREVRDSHPALDVWKNPNKYQTQKEFLSNIYGFRWLLGQSYVMGYAPEGGPNKGLFNEITTMPPQYTEIKLNNNSASDSLIESYVVKGTGGDEKAFPFENVAHIKSWSPDYSQGHNLYGVSPIRAALKKVALSNDSSSTMLKMMQSLGVIGMFVLENGDLDPAQAAALERKYHEKIKDNKTIFTGGKFKWEQAGMSPVDLAILESNQQGFRDICNIFGVSSILFNDSENKTYNNMKEALKSMWTQAILPIVDNTLDTLNPWLIQPHGGNFKLMYDIQAIPELQEDMDKMVGYLKDAYWMKGNEKRGAMGLGIDEESPEMDEYLIPTNLISASGGESEAEKAMQKLLIEAGIPY